MDLTKGPLGANIIKYTIPIMLTGLLQLLFNAADLAVVGIFCGSVSVAAVGATSSLTSMLVNFFIGFSIGLGALVAHGVGEKNPEKMSRSVHTGITFAILCGGILTVIGVAFSSTFLTWMGTPPDVLPLSSLYMKIYFLGIIATIVYNFGAAILRADGDTESALRYIIIAGVLNIILNVIFVWFFDMNVAGVALATTFTQILSAVLVIRKLTLLEDGCRLRLKKIRLELRIVWDIVRIGLPAAIQMSLIAFSNVLIQSSVNAYGSACVAGNAAAQSLSNFNYQIMNAFSQSALNFTGQNFGAGLYNRVDEVRRRCCLYAMICGVAVSVFMYLFRYQLLGIYIKDSAEAVSYGCVRLTVFLTYGICAFQDVHSSVMRGLGISFVPMAIGLLGMVGFRIIWLSTVYRLPQVHNLYGLYISYPISWLITGTMQVIAFRIYRKKYLMKNVRKDENEGENVI